MRTPATHHIALHQRPGGTTIAVTGALDLLAAAELTDVVLGGAGRPVAGDVAIDLSEVHYLDSGGLNALLAARGAVHARGGRLWITAASERAQQILDLVQLTDVFAEPSTAAAQPSG